MTTDRDKQRVSDAYREIATQTTRPEIDEKVLKLAAGGVRSRYGLARAWVRPVAWAATIALSAVIVLQVTQDVEAPVPAPPQEVMDERARKDTDSTVIKEEKATRQEAAKRMPSSTPEVASPAPLRETDASARSAAEPAADVAVSADADAFAAASLEEIAIESAPCGEDARQTAAAWYACIHDLREQGFAGQADRELNELRAAFPDFEPPAE